MRERLRRFENFYSENQRFFIPAAILVGFVLDNLMLNRIDAWLDNLILFSYVFLVALAIVLVNLTAEGTLHGRFIARVLPWFEIFIPFAFGGLFSGFFVFYSRSASLTGSWPFLLILIALFLSTEIFKGRYRRITVQVSLLFFAIFTFLIFFVPVVLGSMGAWVFLISGALSLSVIVVYIVLLYRLLPSRLQEHRLRLFASVGGLFLLINVFYFTNIIPPIPLSLKDIGIYHTLTQTKDGNFAVSYEPAQWYEPFQEYSRTFHSVDNAPVYIFSAVFAPTKLNTTIYHRWEHFDEVKSEWVTTDRIAYSIAGGREEGYRGYSKKSSVTPGSWRVSVETQRGQLLGRKTFTVVATENDPILARAVR